MLAEGPAHRNHHNLTRHRCSLLDSASLATNFPFEAEELEAGATGSWLVGCDDTTTCRLKLPLTCCPHEARRTNFSTFGNEPVTEKHKCYNALGFTCAARSAVSGAIPCYAARRGLY